MKLQVASRLASVTKVRHEVRDYLVNNHMLSPDSLVLGDILLAVTEALSNAVQHSDRADEDLTVTATVQEPDTFEFRLISRQRIDLDEIREHRDSDIDLLSSNGRGLQLIESLMDSVRYIPSPKDPHVVELRMYRQLTSDTKAGGYHAISN